MRIRVIPTVDTVEEVAATGCVADVPEEVLTNVRSRNVSSRVPLEEPSSSAVAQTVAGPPVIDVEASTRDAHLDGIRETLRVLGNVLDSILNCSNKVVILDFLKGRKTCLLYTSPSPRDQRGSRMPSSA